MVNVETKIMSPAASRFRVVLLTGWMILAAAAAVYARVKGIPWWIALPVAAALLIEYPFYLLPGFSEPRAWLGRLGGHRCAAVLVLSSIAPYLAYSVPTGLFAAVPFFALLVIAAAVAFWYVVFPAAAWFDVLFVAVLGALVAFKAHTLQLIYLSPIPKTPLWFLGQLMLIRTGALAILLIRHTEGVDYRFWPRRSEWLTGFRYFAMLTPVAGAAYWALGLVQWRANPLPVWQAAGIFFGILWVVALSEEFFFRGLLQQWLENWTSRPAIALVLTAILFGAVHLGMHRMFPNWRFATVAAIAGLFYGLAWRESRSVQASMVTHALTVTLWRALLR